MHDGDYGTCNFKCRLQFFVSDSFQFVEYLLIVPIESSGSDQDLDFNICLFIFFVNLIFSNDFDRSKYYFSIQRVEYE